MGYLNIFLELDYYFNKKNLDIKLNLLQIFLKLTSIRLTHF